MASAEQARDEAIAATKKQIVDEVAVVLKENWEMIRLGFKEKNLPDFSSNQDKNTVNAEFRRMAEELIETRSFAIVANGEKISLTDIEQEINKNDKGKEFLKTMLKQRSVKSLEELVPNKSHVQQIADKIGSVAYNNNTWYGWATGSWTPEKRALAVRKEVETELGTLNIPFLNTVSIKRAASAAYIKAYEAAGGINVVEHTDGSKPISLEDTEIKPIDAAFKVVVENEIFQHAYQATQDGIRAKIEEEYTKNGFFGSIAKSIGPEWANFFIGIINAIIGMFNYQPYALIPTEQQINATSEIVAGTVKDVLTGEGASKIQDSESANQKVTAAVSGALSAKKQALSLTDEQIKEISTKAGKGAEDNFDKIRQFTNDNQKISSASHQFHQGYNPDIEGYRGLPTNGGVIKNERLSPFASHC